MRPTSDAFAARFLCCAMLFLNACSGDSEPPAESPAEAAATTARFVGEHRRGQVELRGHSASVEHERRLVSLATRKFTAADLVIEFSLLDPAPPYWPDATIRLVDALAATQSASVILTEDRLIARGVALEDWQNRLSLLLASLPESVELAIDVIEPDGTVSVANLCAHAMAQHQAGPINFEESGTVFRSSALPELERIVALASTCRDASIEITGHTDSSGDEGLNQRLSLARAQAVAEFLAQQGIAADRLRTVGAGSARPIADNRFRYGRSLNRRIEIEFQMPDITTPET